MILRTKGKDGNLWGIWQKRSKRHLGFPSLSTGTEFGSGIKELHEKDLSAGYGEVQMPDILGAVRHRLSGQLWQL
jgi:hypothetical protein